jgi:hypothetical protein
LHKNINIKEDSIDRAFKTGVAKAIAEHKRAGHSIAVWKDGKVVIVPPEEIRVPRVRRSRHKPTVE